MNTSLSPQEDPEERSFALGVLLLFLFLLCSSCHPAQHLTIADHTTHDTCYITNYQFDSICVYRESSQEYNRDTLIIKEVNTEYRYRLLHDTIRIVQIDSIPVVHEIEVAKAASTRRNLIDALSLCFYGFVLLVFLILLVFLLKAFHSSSA